MFFSKKKENKKIKKLEEEISIAREDLNEVSSYLNDFLDFLPLAVCDATPSGMIGNVNKAFKDLSGFNTIEASGRKVSDFFLEKTKIEKSLFLAREKIIKNQELTLVAKDNKGIQVSASFAVKKDNQGKTTGYFISITNISGLKDIQRKTEEAVYQRTKELEESRRALLNILEDTEEARRRAEEERNKTQTVFENFIDGLLMFGADGRLEMMNLQAEKFLETSKEKIIGSSIEELKKNKKTKLLAGILSRKRKEVFRREMPLPEKETVVEVTSKFIVSQGRPFATFVILHDITREKVVERLKTQFVSVAAHQLRTPLSIIKWSLAMLLEGEVGLLTREQKEMLSKASQTNDRMIRLINDLLNVARIEEGRFLYQPTVVDLGELIEQTIEPVYHSASNKNVKLEFKQKSEGSTIVKADIEKLSLAIKNLAENAVFYTSSKGRVTVTLTREDGELLVAVKDTGIGIPKNQQDRVFSKFFRAENAVRMETEGTGLGLFIAKNIIEAHEGKIWFESEAGKGTTFYFTLPAIG
jgi:PAS domain S-box-containing protein